MTVTVVGLGKIGLPLAVQFARMGEKVLGADINQETVELVNKGLEPFPEEENLQEYLVKVVSEGKLEASTNTTSCVRKSEVVVVVVPLFVNSRAEPDFRSMDAATADIARGLQPGTLVAYETTLPIGTTRNRFGRMLEEISGLKVGIDFFLVFSPERVLTGRVFEDLRKYPKVVGGINAISTRKGVEFYRQVLDFDPRIDLTKPNGVWELDSAESAEFVKLAETTYRDVNIGLANQFAKFADKLNLNIYDVIEASNSQPYSHIHQPGIAVGGHCIPIYPQFYLWNDPSASIVQAARKTNESMPAYSIDQILENLPTRSTNQTALVAGVSYRAGVKESAFSGVFPVRDCLEEKKYRVFVLDPMYTSEELLTLNLMEYKGNFSEIDLFVIQSEIPGLESVITKLPPKVVILDGRNILSENVRRELDANLIYSIGNKS